jgi:hypothetical protein
VNDLTKVRMSATRTFSGWYCPASLLSDIRIRARSGRTLESGNEAVQERGELGALVR